MAHLVTALAKPDRRNNHPSAQARDHAARSSRLGAINPTSRASHGVVRRRSMGSDFPETGWHQLEMAHNARRLDLSALPDPPTLGLVDSLTHAENNGANLLRFTRNRGFLRARDTYIPVHRETIRAQV